MAVTCKSDKRSAKNLTRASSGASKGNPSHALYGIKLTLACTPLTNLARPSMSSSYATVLWILFGLGMFASIWAVVLEKNRRCWPGLGLAVASVILNLYPS